ncbi:MAG: exodeoxyribonuclease VII large subunit [Candidatus Doudnabacteria bacterium CG10_big_fil_rev_8_21_14_0_10_41_10]|uniref:Exodeoxyribonuclease 7 large subunit n=1 Tax=Candidatus Doudnabacteria bacterium CG10_big_fil_rev_8_21_14_0_10_41_10 TaxID=1974551 RepID=A0A2H0VEB3_9BACT|nr:MAG: exodeoxyribonuclease VII large subunit [Candidatus Doudnabacteria bacterium CG10_big_fil_rev_8_21_14_0_10_41_10]
MCQWRQELLCTISRHFGHDPESKFRLLILNSTFIQPSYPKATLSVSASHFGEVGYKFWMANYMEITDLIQDKIFSVSEFNQFVNDIVTPLRVTVEGEISDFRVSQNKFVWFNLKDNNESLNCFSLTYRIRQPLEDGMKIKIFGYPKIFGRSGKFSFQVEKIEISGEGSLKRAFELLKTKLKKEGVFSENRKRPLPRFPEKIGLITSEQAAAYTDFIRQINSRMGGLTIIFTPVAVQGEKAVPEILAAFEYFNSVKEKPDVLVLTRGGGSLEDLKEFNSEEVVRAVFSSKIPVVVGIGHERDVSLAELAADKRASTPTHAAQLLVPKSENLISEINQTIADQRQIVGCRLEALGYKLNTQTSLLRETILEKFSVIKSARQKFQFEFSMLSDKLQRYKNRNGSLRKLLHSLGPKDILRRGYSIVRKSGKIIRQAGDVKINDELEIEFHKGTISSVVRGLKNL